MASRDARRMFSSSISSGVAAATAYAEESAAITANSRSRRAGERVLESRMAGFSYPGGRITAAAITGPASGPLPASSTPAGERYPRSRASFSKPTYGTALLLRGGLGRRFGRGAFRRALGGDDDPLLGEPVLPLADARLLPGHLAEVEQLRPADVALLLHLDLLEEGGVDRIGALHADAVRLLADLEGGGDAVPVEPDDDPLEILDALLLSLLDPGKDADGVPHVELREVLAKMRGFDILQKRHGHVLSILAAAGPRTGSDNLFQPRPVCQLLPEQLRASLGRTPLPFRPSPRLDGAVVPRQEDVGDCPPAELPGAGVVGRLEKPLRKRSLVRRIRVADHPRKEPRHRVDQHQGGQLPPGEDVIPDGEFLVREVVRHP